MKRLLQILFIATISISSFAQSATLNLKGIRNQKGHIQVSVFENAKQFEDEEPAKILYFDKKDVVKGNKSININLNPGNYGITILDDEDDSKDMTYRLGIYPREGVGFSNYKLSGMTKPKFTDFDFTVQNGNLQILVDMKYF